MSRKITRYSASNNFRAFGALLLGIARIGARLQQAYAEWNYTSAQDRLKQDNLRLKNDLLYHKIENQQLRNRNDYTNHGVISNRVVEGEQRIELNELRIAREKWMQDNAGITAPKFKALDYPEPGNVHRGEFTPDE